MKNVKVISIVLILILSILIIFLQPAIQNIFTGKVVSETPPTIPHIFFGNVAYSGNPNVSLEGCEVTAEFNSHWQGIVGGIDTNNFYSAFIETRGQGSQVIFYVGSVQAFPIAESESFETGGNTQ